MPPLTAIALGLTWVANALILFEVMRLAGAAASIYLGCPGLARRFQGDPPPVADHVHFACGLAVALYRSQTIVFFTAFLPQFVDPVAAGGSACGHARRVGADGGTDRHRRAVAAQPAAPCVGEPLRARLLARLSGSVLIGGGVWLSLARRPA